MKGIVANPNIAPHIKESVLAYETAGLLKYFYTSFICHKNDPLSKILFVILPIFIHEFKRRAFEEIDYKFVRTKPYTELLRVFAARNLSSIITDKIWEKSELSFDKWVARNLTEDLNFIHVVEHTCLSTIKKAKTLNIKSFYEQPSIHHKTFSETVKRQLKIYPDFDIESIKLLYNEASIRRNKRRDEELKLADYIICNSSYTKKTLVDGGVNESKIISIPLGFPDVKIRTTNTKQYERLIFLTAGNLSIGKGTHILIEAWKEINISGANAELWLVGKNNLPESFTHTIPKNIKLFGNIPRTELMIKFAEANVLIHPTLADGFGMVITEAMSCGLPVITTYNSIGPDIIEDKKSGLLIESNNKAAIKDSINWCINNKEKLSLIGIEALKKAKSYPWSEYRKNLVTEIYNRLL
ncbi:glycosyltransferase family 4 protein [Pedobacter jejuensis]|uniref:glycosyltransferase family 4 protein n=1 Tax=Pedobacter jejuensis TaxID=1268550 RepID=UPI00142D3EA4|nr:glycosyltransferase family 4 protein [Pedobacter jejuensis]